MMPRRIIMVVVLLSTVSFDASESCKKTIIGLYAPWKQLVANGTAHLEFADDTTLVAVPFSLRSEPDYTVIDIKTGNRVSENRSEYAQYAEPKRPYETKSREYSHYPKDETDLKSPIWVIDRYGTDNQYSYSVAYEKPVNEMRAPTTVALSPDKQTLAIGGIDEETLFLYTLKKHKHKDN